MSHWSHAAALAVGLLVAAPAPAGPIDEELAEAAKGIRRILGGQGVQKVALGAIESVSDSMISHGPGLARRLGEALGRLGVTIDPSAGFGVAGKYEAKNDARMKRAVIQLDLWVVNRRNGNEKVSGVSRGIYGEEALRELSTPAAVSIPPDLTEEKREVYLLEVIDAQRTKPAAVFDGAAVHASPAKQYGVEVLVKAGGEFVGRKPVLDDGDLVVALTKSEVFRVRLRNNTAHEAAARVTIDGLDTFTFWGADKPGPRGQDQPSFWVVPPGKSITLPGWPAGEGKAHEFLVTSYALSAVAELGGDKASMGILSVTFHACWGQGEKPPADEPAWAGRKSADLGIGIGAEVAASTRRVDRKVGVPRDTISVRYAKK